MAYVVVWMGKFLHDKPNVLNPFTGGYRQAHGHYFIPVVRAAKIREDSTVIFCLVC